MRSLRLKLSTFAAVAIIAAPVFAQTDPSGAKADVVVEIRPTKFINSPLGKRMDFAGQLAAAAANNEPGKPDFSKLDRVLFALVAPDSAEKIEKIQEGEQNEMEFLARLEFATPEAAASVLDQAKEKNAGVIEKNGKKYYKPPAGNRSMPESTVMYEVSDKIVELASEGFAYRTIEMPLTDGLAAAWKAMPDEALRVSVDGVNARGLLKSLAAEGKKNAGNPIAGAVIDLFPTMDNINLSIDLASANLLTMTMVGSDEEKAGDINDGFKSLMTIVKPMANQGLGMLKQQMPEPAAVYSKIVNDMDVTQAGRVVTLSVPRSEGFEDATVKVIPMLRGLVQMMMMGGGQGGPGGPGGPPPGDF